MGIPINNGGQSRRPPAVNLANPGDFFDFFVINEETAPLYVYGKNEVATKQDGTPKTKSVITVLAHGGAATIKDPETQQPRQVQPGDVVTIHIQSYTRWDPDRDKTKAAGQAKSWSGAKEDLGQLMVGDFGRYTFESTEQGRGAEPRKVRTFRLRHSKPEEAQQQARCEQLHREGTGIPVGAPAGGGYGPDDEPF